MFRACCAVSISSPAFWQWSIVGADTTVNTDWRDLCQGSIWFYVSNEYSAIWCMMSGRKWVCSSLGQLLPFCHYWCIRSKMDRENQLRKAVKGVNKLHLCPKMTPVNAAIKYILNDFLGSLEIFTWSELLGCLDFHTSVAWSFHSCP